MAPFPAQHAPQRYSWEEAEISIPPARLEDDPEEAMRWPYLFDL